MGGLDKNAQRALDLYNEAVKLKEKGELPSKGFVDVSPIRVKLAADVNTGKADPNCKRCHGTGVIGYKQVPGNRACETMRVPIICRCVVRNGGVKQDRFDKMMTQLQEKESNNPEAPQNKGQQGSKDDR